MKNLAYYISDYGYGHASRSISIIRGLLEVDSSIHITICTSFAMSFLRKSLISDRISFRIINTDVGYYLNKDTIKPDAYMINKTYELFVKDWEKKMIGEFNFLLQKKIDLVISDISPLPFEAASQLNITSIGISNFTWYTAYENIINEDLLQIFKNAYNKMEHFYLLAGNNEYNWNCKKNKYSFFSRKVDKKEVQRIKEVINVNRDKKIIYFGLGMKINSVDVNSLSLWDSKDCVFVVSSNINIVRNNIITIPHDYTESQNYIAACDLVISKAGWGTISETVVNQIPLLILNRKELKEDQNTIKYIIDNDLGHIIEWEDLINYQFKHNEKYKNRYFKNEVDNIVEDLLALIYSAK